MKHDCSARSPLKALFYAASLAASVCLVAAGLGIAELDTRKAQAPISPLSAAESERDIYERLEHLAGSMEPAQHGLQSKADTLPDVHTMIERLATRLEKTPGDVRGWKMLGWSYFQLARYEEAAAAYARALGIEPGSAEIKALLETSKAKASAAP